MVFRDDKSFPYILITQDHDFPRIDFYRGIKKRNGLYFGPYPSSIAVRETIQLIQKLFRLRSCTDHFFKTRSRPCLLYQIGRCTGPCVDYISQQDYQESVRLSILFLQGKSQQLIDDLNREMEAASTALHYELASKYRDQILKLRQIQERQYVNANHGNADVIGFAAQSNIACLQLLSVRDGRILGSRAYFPAMLAGTPQEEVIHSFITQHYLGKIEQEIPSQIILGIKLSDTHLLENMLTERAQNKVALVHAVRGERNKWLETAVMNAKQSVAGQLANRAHLNERFQALQTALRLIETPERIECFDISHTMGEETVASCVVFDKNGPIKNDYRRFNISGVTPGDDVGAMKQALLRRYKHLQTEPEKIPDILLIDGGKAQLNAAETILQELGIHNVLLIGVAKGEGRKPGLETLMMVGQPPLNLPTDSLALHLIQYIRDEAHRFAITSHRRRRDKKRHVSILESIPGIGINRRRELLRYFGGIQAINHASLDEIAKVPGINRSLAQRIFAALHKD